MKNIRSRNEPLLLAAMLLFMVSCKNEESVKEPLYPNTATKDSPAVSGQEIFEQQGNCASCHQPDQKVIGPSIVEIAKIYKAQNGDIVSFLRGKAEPIVDPSQYAVMQTNFAITKAMSDAELKALEAYIYSFDK